MSEENTNKLVCCFVTSRLDYCNSLLAGLPNSRLSRLQQIQNNAARLVKHITPILKELHWLPIPSRINYKTLTTVFQCRNDTSFPRYLTDSITSYVSARYLRSRSKHLLVKPRYSLKTYGQRSFFYQAPELWNSLPEDLKNANSSESFKKLLKTHLFKEVFY